MSPFAASRRREPFDPKGRVVARRHVTLSREYQPGEDIPASEGISERTLWQLWDQSTIDTIPPAPTSATPPAPAKQQPNQQRR